MKKDEQGFVIKKEEMKTNIAMAGSGIMNINSNQAAGSKLHQGYPNQGMGGNAMHLQQKPTDQFGASQNKRGSEFKKSAQHILGRQ